MPEPLTPEMKALAHYANGMQVALVVMANCLMNNGALRPGQFSNALKATFNEPDADWSRLDYWFLQQLAKMMDEAETRDRI
jgi:hypothetical protein